MRILFVASFNKNRFAPFVVEQADALRNAGCEVSFFGVQGKGVRGYLKALPLLKEKIMECHPDVVHAHYGLCGLLAGLQRKVPVVTTYHGSDINLKSVRPLSKLAMILSRYNIFVSKKTLKMASPHKHFMLLPCGIDLSDSQLTSKQEARARMHLDEDKKYVLFAGAFNNAVKNAPLAQEAVALLPDVTLMELKGYSREQVNLLMCAADAFLMTSISEGSPQVVKEAMACGCPIVSVDVGDVSERIMGLEGCYLAERTPEEVAEKLKKALSFDGRTDGRQRLVEQKMTNEFVSSALKMIYESVKYEQLIAYETIVNK